MNHESRAKEPVLFDSLWISQQLLHVLISSLIAPEQSPSPVRILEDFLLLQGLR